MAGVPKSTVLLGGGASQPKLYRLCPEHPSQRFPSSALRWYTQETEPHSPWHTDYVLRVSTSGAFSMTQGFNQANTINREMDSFSTNIMLSASRVKIR